MKNLLKEYEERTTICSVCGDNRVINHQLTNKVTCVRCGTQFENHDFQLSKCDIRFSAETMNESKNIQESTKKAWSIGVVVARFFMLFKPKCPECGSRDNNVECYAVNPYAKNERRQTGRQCNNCTNFWYK